MAKLSDIEAEALRERWLFRARRGCDLAVMDMHQEAITKKEAQPVKPMHMDSTVDATGAFHWWLVPNGARFLVMRTNAQTGQESKA